MFLSGHNQFRNILQKVANLIFYLFDYEKTILGKGINFSLSRLEADIKARKERRDKMNLNHKTNFLTLLLI